MKYDVLIIGHGIAGCVLSFMLLKEGKNVLVLDEPKQNESSRVAAGLYNPITGRKMVKTWQADLLFPLLKAVYEEMQDTCEEKIFYDRPIYRPFISVAEQNEWQGKAAEEGWQGYINEIKTTAFLQDQIHNPYGGIVVGNSGWVNLPLLLNSWSKKLEEKGMYRQQIFDENKLEASEEEFKYDDVTADAVVYTNGRFSAESKFWNWLPFKPLKGEVLHISTDLETSFIPNRGVFIAPDTNRNNSGSFRVGSTYNHHDLSLEPTVDGRQQLEEKLTQLLKLPYTITGQKVGIRPATRDRRPFVGVHPKIKNLYLLNGLGTKGVSLAPFCATALVGLLLFEGKIPAEINIERYFSLY